MCVRVTIYLESDEFGREYFDADADVKALLESAEKYTAQDGVTRRVGCEVTPESEDEE